MGEVTARLAIILHHVETLYADRPDPGRVDARTMRDAIRLTTWFKAEAKRVYGVLDETETGSGERKLIEFLQRRGGTATARDVHRGCRWLREPGKAEEALEWLVQRGLGRWEPFTTSPRGGPTARQFTQRSVDVVSTEPSETSD